jgi:hypothetical protein
LQSSFGFELSARRDDGDLHGIEWRRSGFVLVHRYGDGCAEHHLPDKYYDERDFGERSGSELSRPCERRLGNVGFV